MKIKVSVKPNSGSSVLEKISDLEYRANLKAVPEKGKANLELIKLLAKEFKVSAKNIEIKTTKSRKKIVEIHNN